MEKQELLGAITQAAKNGLISKEEVIKALGETGHSPIGVRKSGIANILYYIGGAIVFLGIVILLAQNWEKLGPTAQVLSSLGSGVAAYSVGVLFWREASLKGAGNAFFLISALVLPLGMYITLDKAGVDTSTAGISTLIAAVMLAIFAGSYFLFRHLLFAVWGVIFGTWLFQAAIQTIVGSSALNFRIEEYRVLVNGLAWLLLGYHFDRRGNSSFAGALYGFGAVAFLGAALALGGFRTEKSAFWELVYPLIAFAFIFLSVYLKSKSFLVFGSLFLIAYIFKLTAEYFSESLGWPAALVIAGLLIIAVAYYAVRVNNRLAVKHDNPTG